MKTYIITNSKDQTVKAQEENSRLYKVVAEGEEDMQVSDGFHTMDELYEHRFVLYIKLAAVIAAAGKGEESHTFPAVWRSSYHSDGSFLPGWFILGIGKEKGKQITYHLPTKLWFDCGFAETIDRAPEWDGHTPADVLERIKYM